MEKTITLNNGTSVYEMDFLTKVASYIYCTSALNTSSDAWFVEFSDIEERFDLPAGFIDDDMAERIRDTIFKEFDNQISECRIFNNQGGKRKFKGYFYIYLFGDYTPNWDNYSWGTKQNEN